MDAMYTLHRAMPCAVAVFIHYTYPSKVPLQYDVLLPLTEPVLWFILAPTHHPLFRNVGLFRRAVLALGLALLELLDFLLDGLVYPALQLGAVAEHEENLEPDEERREEDSLHEVV